MKLQNTFVESKLNKDIDERLLPKGQYPDALNIRVANSDGSDVGAIENVKGNEKITALNLTNASAIGTYSDGSSQKLYWFVTSDEKDLVMEYDVYNDQITVVLESSNPNGVLNFNKNNLITGVVKIINGDGSNDLLAWTDDLNPPRLINIKRAIDTYTPDSFTDEAISLIKRPPLYAPSVRFTYSKIITENYLLDKFVSFSYRNRYEDGEYSSLSSFTNYKFAPSSFKLDYPSMENSGMENTYNAVEITFNTGSSLVKKIDLVYKESGINTIYVIETFDKEKEGWGDNEEKSYIFNNSKINKVLPEDELFRVYDNVPLKAKALDLVNNRLIFGNYVEGYDLKDELGGDINIDYKVSLSTTSLVTTPVVTSASIRQVPLPILYKAGLDFTGIDLSKDTKLTFDFNLVETDQTDFFLATEYTGFFRNKFEYLLTKDYATGGELSEDVDFIYFVESIINNYFKNNFTPTPFLTLNTTSTYATITDMLAASYNTKYDMVYYVQDASSDPAATNTGEYYRANVSFQPSESYTPLTLSDFTRLTGDDRNDYIPKTSTISIESGFGIESFSPLFPNFDLNLPTIIYDVSYTPLDDAPFTLNVTTYWGLRDIFTFDVNHINIGLPFSLKTNRSYEASLLYLDGYNRASTALTNSKFNKSSNNTVFVPSRFSTNQNKMVISINNQPPAWATRYKIVVKENKGDYHTIYTNISYRDGIYRWIKLEGESVKKVQEGDELIVKSDSGGYIEDVVKTKVLAIESKEKGFILGNIGITGDEVIEESGLYMKIRPIGFSIDTYASRSVIEVDGSQSLRYVRPVYLTPELGEYDEQATPVFTPYALSTGDKVTIKIVMKASGNIEYNATYDNTFTVEGDSYASVAEWFNAEVTDLGQFGIDYTWDGITGLKHSSDYPNTPVASHKGTGWGFTDNIDNTKGAGWNTAGTKTFFIFPHRDGTAARNIRTSVNFSIQRVNSSVIFETSPSNFNGDIFYETEETFDIVTEGASSKLVHEGNIQNQSNVPTTSGSLVVDCGYFIHTLGVGDDFSNIGADNVEGEIFIATGDTPSVWTNGSVLYKTATSKLDYGNCYVQGNGVESYRYKDAFNASALTTDIRPTAIDNNGYKSVRRYADLTYSEPYNSSTNINGLNEFNLARANYKDDVDKKFGSIQRVYSRDTDLLLFQEDKVSRVLYGKSLLMNADGTSNVSIVESVLGTQIAYAGEYGISFNPESFAINGNNVYFSDVKRGSILRLGLDGVNEISKVGLSQWFKEKFFNSVNNTQLGAFDPYLDQYVINTNGDSTLTFSEDVKGWTSFHSFMPEYMVGINNKFFSFKNGELYEHHSGNVPRNNYYGVQYNSSIDVMVNDSPSEIKEIQALSLEGNQSWQALIKAFVSNSDDYMQSTVTTAEFVKKEGIWYAYTRRNESDTIFDSKATYGLGTISELTPTLFTLNGGSTSLCVGDIIVRGANLQQVGVITNITNGLITMDTTTGLVNGDFVVGMKDARIEGGNLRGYTIRVGLTNSSVTKVELFAVNLEVMKSFS